MSFYKIGVDAVGLFILLEGYDYINTFSFINYKTYVSKLNSFLKILEIISPLKAPFHSFVLKLFFNRPKNWFIILNENYF